MCCTIALRRLLVIASLDGRMRALITAIAIIASTSTPSTADEPAICRPRSEVLSHLARSYGELPKGAGLTDAGNLLEVLSAANGSTWSIIVTTPQGTSCLVAAGEAWKELEKPPTDDGNLIHRDSTTSYRLPLQ